MTGSEDRMFWWLNTEEEDKKKKFLNVKDLVLLEFLFDF